MIPAAEPVVLSKNLMNEHFIPAHSVTPLPADNLACSDRHVVVEQAVKGSRGVRIDFTHVKEF